MRFHCDIPIGRSNRVSSWCATGLLLLPLHAFSFAAATTSLQVDASSIATTTAAEPTGFIDATGALGLAGLTRGDDGSIGLPIARVQFVDLDNDGFPDLIVDRHRVFMNRPVAAGMDGIGRRFVEVDREVSGLEPPQAGTVTVFVDLNNNGFADAVIAEHVDLENPAWVDHGRRTRWQPGLGDGTFAPPILLPVPPRTTHAIAVADVNRDGRLDLWFGNGYVRYGGGLAGYPNDLLLSVGSLDVDPHRESDGESDRGGEPEPSDAAWRIETLPESLQPFDPLRDQGGRPTYGVLIWRTADDARPLLLELAYGRRWNRLWRHEGEAGWVDRAPAVGLDGDAVRHGRHPAWLRERARSDPRFDRKDEAPFRSNGNTFDAAVGDVDGDGQFDLLLTEITHGWAGSSSDRTRLLFAWRPPGDRAAASEMLPLFVERGGFSLDRVPPSVEGAPVHSWNQGDLFGALADLDHDGRLDAIVSSGDYPDDQRLRVFLQHRDGWGLHDATGELDIDHDGSQQISLGDVEGNGALDIVAGQTFNRYPAAMREGRSPHPVVFLNRAVPSDHRSLTLILEGDGVRANRDAIGSLVRVEFEDGRSMLRLLTGPGGHAGKQDQRIVHIGLGASSTIQRLVVEWPDLEASRQSFESVPAGRYRLRMGESLEPLDGGEGPSERDLRGQDLGGQDRGDHDSADLDSAGPGSPALDSGG